MNVLSLFDGMSCGQLALNRAGIKYDTYFASEIDKHAIKVTQANFPNTVQIGDVTEVVGSLLPQIDLLIGGSPCQGFSFAGKQLNFSDPRSFLFFEFVRLLNECKPRYFLLENVKMKKEYQDVISEYLGVHPIQINSALVSAQNRVRLYWTNIPGVEQPEDRGILLKDILEDNVDSRYNITEATLSRIVLRKWSNPKINPDKGGPVLAKNNSGQMSTDSGTTLVRCAASRGINQDDPTNMSSGLDTVQHLEPRYDGKTNCLTSVQKDNYVHIRSVIQLNRSKESNGCQPYQQNRVYDPNGICPSLMADMSSGTHAINHDETIRRLTEIECERLQTVPDNEIICIFALCLDQVKNYVNAVEQNPRLLKLALNAGEEKLNEFVKLVNQNTKQNNLKIKCIVQQSADITTKMQINQCTKINQKESDITVSNAENTVMSKNQNQEVASVLPSVFINIIEGKIIHFGTEELHRKDNYSTNHLNGEKPLILFGNEIMELVKNVDAGMKRNSDTSFTSTTLSVLNINNLEQMLATYYLFAKNVITGYTQNTTIQKSLLVQFQINDGYTNHVSSTQRYKMLGNGWTVDVIAHILKGIKSDIQYSE